MKIFYYGGRNAGMAVLLGIIAAGHEVMGVIPVDQPVENVANKLGIPVLKPKNVNFPEVVDMIKKHNVELFLCCHGRQIIKENLLNAVPAMNMHPLLFKYPGAASVARMLAAGETKASVAAHWMTEFVDRGEVIVENFMEVEGKTEIEVYNELYWLYVTTCLEALVKIKDIVKKK
ncbi:MAG: hypothetical protein A2666_02265 [Parcubacteria group bacterium RIFCSPHIGHO2_01_FULL_47_10b]|nr:MAG: hypothetical protein A2666_02265 [Parcubacteria group bacterium RIFCSPHIGHO2_01_FULL_47_10b]